MKITFLSNLPGILLSMSSVLTKELRRDYSEVYRIKDSASLF
jgi:hypothetical protein